MGTELPGGCVVGGTRLITEEAGDTGDWAINQNGHKLKITNVRFSLPAQKDKRPTTLSHLSHIDSLYICGPMRGYPENNFPAFRVCAKDWRTLGFEVFSPVEMDEADGPASYNTYIRRDL